MHTYRCTCGNRLFFENTQCVVCGCEVGWCESCSRITTLELAGDNPLGGRDYRCSHMDCRATLRKCHNYAIENVCNRLFDPTQRDAAEPLSSNIASSNLPAPLPPTPLPPAPLSPAPAPAQATAPAPLNPAAGGIPAAAPLNGAPLAATAIEPTPIEPAPAPPVVIPKEHLCAACQLNNTIPDLTVPGHREMWARLEAAKRRLLYTLDRLALPINDAHLPLTFDFKADVEPPADDWRSAGPAEIVYTGHADGNITINLREADDAERERLRITFHEAHRTLIGHFHHEIGHYYWQLLVEGHPWRERQFKNLFGDHNNPTYADAMAAYYQNGPRQDWAESFISAYASAHPWEDFAETFALYLDGVAVLDTASHLFKSIKANFRGKSIALLVERFQEVGILVNEFNRTMGLIDLVPEVVVGPVVAKLQFVHDMVRNAGQKRRKKSPELAAVGEAPIPMLMQQGSLQYLELPVFEPAILV